MTPTQRVDRILAEAVGSDLSSWEKHTFLPSIRQWKSLTDRQETTLRGIERRVFHLDGDDE